MKYFTFAILLLGVPMFAFAQETAQFVPLTNIPAFTEIGNSINTPEGLSDFLNNVYRLCIGIAAVVAVLQIMRAGIMYMGGDSVTEKKEAKNLIALSIGGLILVLSPVVVFSIINPEILSLKINGIDSLKTTLSEADRDDTMWTDTSSTRAAAKARCDAEGGETFYTCKPAGGATRTVPYSEACASGEDGISVCRRTANTPAAGSCTAYGTPTASIGQTCTTPGSRQLERSCCNGLSDSAVCCGVPVSDNDKYAYKGEYYVSGSCAINPETAATCETQIIQGGAFVSKTQCEREFASATAQKVLKNTICSCNTTLGSQLGATCLGNLP